MNTLSFVGNHLNGLLDYGLKQLDAGTTLISTRTFQVAHTILQTEPKHWFCHRFSPNLYTAILWLEEHPKAINVTVNLSMIAFHLAQGSVGLDTITHLLQLFINDKTHPKCNRLLTIINAVDLYRVGTSQLLGTTQSSRVYALVESLVHFHNICYNNLEINAQTIR